MPGLRKKDGDSLSSTARFSNRWITRALTNPATDTNDLLRQTSESITHLSGAVKEAVPDGIGKKVDDLRPPVGRIVFYGTGSRVDLGKGPLEGPMVYATGSQFLSCREASLVELPLAISSEPLAEFERLPYWPTYHDANPRQRNRYLEWLYGGRSDPSVELGYVFTFFYGLETRVLVDHSDHEFVMDELLRLLPIYSHSRSFYSYTTSLLWLTAALYAPTGLLTASKIGELIAATPKWLLSPRAHMKAVAAEVGLAAFPDNFKVHLTLPDDGLPTSTVAKRHPEKLNELFTKRMTSEFPDGISPNISQNACTIEYRPASATIPSDKRNGINSRRWPTIRFDRRQLKSLLRFGPNA